MYCTVQDIIDRISEDVLIRLTDDDGTDIINEDKIINVIEESEGEIDSYCQARYTLPFNPVPKVIKKIAVDLVVYTLFARRGLNPDDNADQIVIQQRKDAIRFLENLAKGLVTIGPVQQETKLPDNEVQFTSPPKIFSRESMNGY
jgi:phage gp36-like protein